MSVSECEGRKKQQVSAGRLAARCVNTLAAHLHTVCKLTCCTFIHRATCRPLTHGVFAALGTRASGRQLAPCVNNHAAHLPAGALSHRVTRPCNLHRLAAHLTTCTHARATRFYLQRASSGRLITCARGNMFARIAFDAKRARIAETLRFLNMLQDAVRPLAISRLHFDDSVAAKSQLVEDGHIPSVFRRRSVICSNARAHRVAINNLLQNLRGVALGRPCPKRAQSCALRQHAHATRSHDADSQ